MPDLDAPADVRESGQWRCRFTIADYLGDIDPSRLDELVPIRVVETDNLLVFGGVSALWQCLIGNGTATAGAALTFFNNANATIGAGNGLTAVAATDTNLVGASKLRRGMNSGYPQHTDGVVAAAAKITFQSTFGTADANFDWQEIGIFNHATDGSGRMLNRKTQAIGVKSSSVSRVVTAEITIA